MAVIREVLSKFTGGQLTAIVITAILCPTAVGASYSFQPVAIIDPATGKQSMVDNGRRLIVYDPVAGDKNNPSNLVNISAYLANNGTTQVLYTVPSGTAIVLTSASMSYFGGVAGNDNYTYCYRKTPTVQHLIANFDDTAVAGTHNMNFGSGIYLRSGDVLRCQGRNGAGSTMSTAIHFEGYKVSNSSVPAATTQAADDQAVQVGMDPRHPDGKH